MEADGASLNPLLLLVIHLRVFKATVTQIREKFEQTFESLRVKLGTSRTEGNTLTNCDTCLLLVVCNFTSLS